MHNENTTYKAAEAMVDVVFNNFGFSLNTTDMFDFLHKRNDISVSRGTVNKFFYVLRNVYTGHGMFKLIGVTVVKDRVHVQAKIPKLAAEDRKYLVERWWALYNKKATEYLTASKEKKQQLALEKAAAKAAKKAAKVVKKTSSVKAILVQTTETAPTSCVAPEVADEVIKQCEAFPKVVDTVGYVRPRFVQPNERLISNKTMHVYSGLLGIVQKKGGDVSCFNWENMHNISAAELLVTLATNDIGFAANEID